MKGILTVLSVISDPPTSEKPHYLVSYKPDRHKKTELRKTRMKKRRRVQEEPGEEQQMC